MYILLALLIFGILIFIHELGHFLVAKLCGVTILEFSIGMGPKLFSVKSKKSGTAYSLRLLPIGGYVSMLGENGMEPVQGSSQPAETRQAPGMDLLINETPEPDTEPAAPEEDPALDKHAYCNQSVWKRILISIAGPLMNVVLGFVLMAVMVVSSGIASLGTTEVAGFYISYTAEEESFGFRKGDQLYSVDDKAIPSMSRLLDYLEEHPGNHTVCVERLSEDGTAIEYPEFTDIPLTVEFVSTAFTNSLSEQSGLAAGDVVTKVNSTRVHTYNELAYEIMNQGYRPLTLTVRRGEENVTLEGVIVPSYVDSGVTFGDLDFRVYREESFDLPTILRHTWFRSVSTVKMVFDSLGGLFSGRYGVEAVSGPVGITKTISDAAKTGILNVLYLVTVISINLGIMNLLPLPALDGGHLLLYVIELIRRKPMKKEVEGIINFVGLILILALAVIISIKDIIAL